MNIEYRSTSIFRYFYIYVSLQMFDVDKETRYRK